MPAQGTRTGHRLDMSTLRRQKPGPSRPASLCQRISKCRVSKPYPSTLLLLAEPMDRGRRLCPASDVRSDLRCQLPGSRPTTAAVAETGLRTCGLWSRCEPRGLCMPSWPRHRPHHREHVIGGCETGEVVVVSPSNDGVGVGLNPRRAGLCKLEEWWSLHLKLL